MFLHLLLLLLLLPLLLQEQPQLQRFQRQLQLPPLLLMTMNDDVLDAVSTFLFLPLLLVLPLLCCKSSC